MWFYYFNDVHIKIYVSDVMQFKASYTKFVTQHLVQDIKTIEFVEIVLNLLNALIFGN